MFANSIYLKGGILNQRYVMYAVCQCMNRNASRFFLQQPGDCSLKVLCSKIIGTIYACFLQLEHLWL